MQNGQIPAAKDSVSSVSVEGKSAQEVIACFVLEVAMWTDRRYAGIEFCFEGM